MFYISNGAKCRATRVAKKNFCKTGLSFGCCLSSAASNLWPCVKRYQRWQMCGLHLLRATYLPHLSCRQAAIICRQFLPSACHRVTQSAIICGQSCHWHNTHAAASKPDHDVTLGKGCEKVLPRKKWTMVHTWIFTHGALQRAKIVLADIRFDQKNRNKLLKEQNRSMEDGEDTKGYRWRQK